MCLSVGELSMRNWNKRFSNLCTSRGGSQVEL